MTIKLGGLLFALAYSVYSCEINFYVTRTSTRSCQTRKCAFHFYSPGAVRRSHAAARQVRARGPVAHAATHLSPSAAAAAAADAV